MFTTSTSSRQAFMFALPVCAALVAIGCGKKAEPPASTEQAKQPAAHAPAISSPDEPPAPSSNVILGPVFARRTGDLDEMVKSRNIRALLILSPIGFFTTKGSPEA